MPSLEVITLTGRVIPCTLPEGATLAQLRDAVNDKEGIPQCQQRFRQMDGETPIDTEDTDLFAAHGVADGGQVKLFLKLR